MKLAILALYVGIFGAFAVCKAAEVIDSVEVYTANCNDCGMTFTGTISIKVYMRQTTNIIKTEL
jgi:hypothetical protein